MLPSSSTRCTRIGPPNSESLLGIYSVLILAITHGLDIPDYIIDKLHPDQLRLLEVEAAGSLASHRATRGRRMNYP